MTWKNVVGLCGLYEVSDTGIIRRTNTKRPLKAFDNHKGYPNVVMHINGKAISKTVHRIVAEAFIPNPSNLPQVNHKDTNKHNNQIGNLEWITGIENMRHAFRNGCFKPHNRKQKEAALKNIQHAQGWNKKSVVCMDKTGNVIAEFESISAGAKATGCDASKIVMCCKGNRYHTLGFRWKYKEDE